LFFGEKALQFQLRSLLRESCNGFLFFVEIFAGMWYSSDTGSLPWSGAKNAPSDRFWDMMSCYGGVRPQKSVFLEIILRSICFASRISKTQMWDSFSEKKIDKYGEI